MNDDFAAYRDLHVLIIDDESFVRTMVKQMLRSLGIINIREADEGATALKEAQLFPPDVIICDLNMQPIDGLVFVQMLRNHQNPSLRDIPVIILSGKSDLTSVKEATARGINGYLIKPVSLQSLKNRLMSVFKDPRYVKISNPPHARDLSSQAPQGSTGSNLGLSGGFHVFD